MSNILQFPGKTPVETPKSPDPVYRFLEDHLLESRYLMGGPQGYLDHLEVKVNETTLHSLTLRHLSVRSTFRENVFPGFPVQDCDVFLSIIQTVRSDPSFVCPEPHQRSLLEAAEAYLNSVPVTQSYLTNVILGYIETIHRLPHLELLDPTETKLITANKWVGFEFTNGETKDGLWTTYNFSFSAAPMIIDDHAMKILLSE